MSSVSQHRQRNGRQQHNNNSLRSFNGLMGELPREYLRKYFAHENFLSHLMMVMISRDVCKLLSNDPLSHLNRLLVEWGAHYLACERHGKCAEINFRHPGRSKSQAIMSNYDCYFTILRSFAVVPLTVVLFYREHSSMTVTDSFCFMYHFLFFSPFSVV